VSTPLPEVDVTPTAGVVIEVEVPDFVAAAIKRVATRSGLDVADLVTEAIRCSDWFQKELTNG
jgi:hypothetical protein